MNSAKMNRTSADRQKPMVEHHPEKSSSGEHSAAKCGPEDERVFRRSEVSGLRAFVKAEHVALTKKRK